MTLHWHRMTALERDAAVGSVFGWQSPISIADERDCTRIINAMRQRECSFHTDCGLDGEWTTIFYRALNGQWWHTPNTFSGSADSMPEATAIAALRAVGVTVDTEDAVAAVVKEGR